MYASSVHSARHQLCLLFSWVAFAADLLERLRLSSIGTQQSCNSESAQPTATGAVCQPYRPPAGRQAGQSVQVDISHVAAGISIKTVYTVDYSRGPLDQPSQVHLRSTTANSFKPYGIGPARLVTGTLDLRPVVLAMTTSFSICTAAEWLRWQPPLPVSHSASSLLPTVILGSAPVSPSLTCCPQHGELVAAVDAPAEQQSRPESQLCSQHGD